MSKRRCVLSVRQFRRRAACSPNRRLGATEMRGRVSQQKLKKEGSYEISSFHRYFGIIHWDGDCDRTKWWLLWRPMLPARQCLLWEVTARLKSRDPRRRNPARVLVCLLLAVNCQGCDLGVLNWQSGHVGESGALSGLIGAGMGTAGSSTPMRLFTQCTWYAQAGSGAAFCVHDQLLKWRFTR
jgi:hypothetical protein